MILILLAAITCVIAWYLATWARPVMVTFETFRLIHATEARFVLSVLAAAAMALLSVGLVLLVLFKAKNPILCLLSRAVLVIPAMIAGYVVVHGITHTAIEPAIGLKLLCGTAGLITGIAAPINLNGFGGRGPAADQAKDPPPRTRKYEGMTGPRNLIINADCTLAMRAFGTGSVDFILTDPPYVTRFRDRQGRTVANDDNARWLPPAFAQMHRVLKDGGFCVSFCGWNKVDLFVEAWKAAGFRIVGYLVFRKRCA